jgi:hypothetical protein
VAGKGEIIMGDRGNIYVQMSENNGDDGVYLYTHWCGSCVKDIVYNALQRRQRWDDPAYLTRILFCEMLRMGGLNIVETVMSEIGFGISTYIGENSHDIIFVNPFKQTVNGIPCIKTLSRNITKYLFDRLFWICSIYS